MGALEKKDLLILIATLATTEVSVGAVAKADQNINYYDKIQDFTGERERERESLFKSSDAV